MTLSSTLPTIIPPPQGGTTPAPPGVRAFPVEKKTAPCARPAYTPLILEDDYDARTIYSDRLVHHGYRTLVAASGEAALGGGQEMSYDGAPDKRVIHKAISRLREKIGADKLVCIRGRGYLLR